MFIKMFNNCNSTNNGELLFYQKIKPSIDTIFDIGARDDSLFLIKRSIILNPWKIL